MKKLHLILSCMLFMIFSISNAQTKTGYEFFKGKWNLDVSGPYGNVTMILNIEKNGDLSTATLKDKEGKELYKVIKTTVKDNEAIVTFTGSQSDVAMVLDRKDDDHITGNIMEGVATVAGTRIVEKK